jgi:hypothetical protein
MEEKPYWPMSRLDLPRMNKFDWLFKSTQPHPSPSVLEKAKKPKPPTPTPQPRPDPDLTIIEHVGFKPSEYQAAPQRPPLRGSTGPWERGPRKGFRDLHTPIQVTHKFNGGSILSVPLKEIKTSRRTHTPPQLAKRSETPKVRHVPIHQVLYEESVCQREEIDPWGYSRNEKVVAPDAVFQGVRLTVSRLHHKREK